MAFRYDNKVFVVLNNMLTSSQSLDLQLMSGQLGNVLAISAGGLGIDVAISPGSVASLAPRSASW